MKLTFVERYEKQPFYRVLIDNSVVYQSLSRKRAYAFYLTLKKEIEKENK